jgi:hypothetical protein
MEKGVRLVQGFPTCGTGTTGGTRVGVRWYAETFKIKASLLVKILFSIIYKMFKEKQKTFICEYFKL